MQQFSAEHLAQLANRIEFISKICDAKYQVGKSDPYFDYQDWYEKFFQHELEKLRAEHAFLQEFLNS